MSIDEATTDCMECEIQDYDGVLICDTHNKDIANAKEVNAEEVKCCEEHI